MYAHFCRHPINKLLRSHRFHFHWQALAPTIRFYSSFITAYDKAVSTLEMHCSHNKRLRQFLYETHRLPECRHLDLAGFLIMPIQRVPRYNLLLSDLVKSTPEYYDDFAALNLALARMKVYPLSHT